MSNEAAAAPVTTNAQQEFCFLIKCEGEPTGRWSWITEPRWTPIINLAIQMIVHQIARYVEFEQFGRVTRVIKKKDLAEYGLPENVPSYRLPW